MKKCYWFDGCEYIICSDSPKFKCDPIMCNPNHDIHVSHKEENYYLYNSEMTKIIIEFIKNHLKTEADYDNLLLC